MELTEKWMRRLIVGTLVVTVTLQVAAILMPGWMVRVRDSDHEEYRGLFYAQRCYRLTGTVEEVCETRSFLEWHRDDRAVIQKRGHIALAQEDLAYHRQVKKQIFVVVAFVATLLTAVAEGLTLRNYMARHPRRTAVAAVTSTLASAFIIDVLSECFIEIDYWREVMDPDSTGIQSYVGVPYSVAIYGLACVLSAMGSIFLMLHCSQLNLARKEPRVSFPTVLDNHPVRENKTFLDNSAFESEKL